MDSRYARLLRFGAATTIVVLVAAIESLAADYSIDPTSPEVPFTFSVGDVVNHDGNGINLAASQLGLGLNDNVDALSYGDDQVEPGGRENIVNFDFSVDRTSVGAGGTVSAQAAGNGAAGDKFRIIAFRNGRTVGPQLLSDSTSHGLTLKSSGTTESDIDAMALVAGTKMPVYYSVDRAGSIALPAVGPADIMYVAQPGVSAPTVFATAAQLGLTSNDNIDALCIMDLGTVGQLDGRDLVYVSFDRTSPTRAANFGGGNDGVLRIWPRPFRTIYTASQLDLTGADELNAMTARDPGPMGPFGSWTGLPKGAPAAALTDKKVQKLVLRGHHDLSIRTRFRYEAHAGEDREPGLSFSAKEENAYGFSSLPYASNGDLSIRLSASYKLEKGLQVGLANWGCEVDFDTTPGMIPSRFLYVGVTRTPNGLNAYVNDSLNYVGTPHAFDGAKELQLSLVFAASLGADVSARVPGGEWQSLFKDPNYQLGTTLTAGFGASRLDPGAKVYVSDIQMEGSLYGDVHAYTHPLSWGGIDLGRAAAALDPDVGDDVDPDFAEASYRLALYLGTSLGTPPAPPKHKITRPYADGLVLEIRDQTLGALPEFVSAKKASASLLKSAKFAEKAQKQLAKSKPNAKKARKLVLKAIKAVDDTTELLTYGKKLK